MRLSRRDTPSRRRSRAPPRDRAAERLAAAPPPRARDSRASPLRAGAVKYLSALEPESLLPPLSVGVAEGLQAVTAVHQTSSALSLLATLTPLLLVSQV